MQGNYGLWGLLVLALDIVAIYAVLTSGLSTAKKALWMFLILLLPVVGMILWFVIGKRT
jgi:hypothetical protein